MLNDETIVAISTPYAVGGISIIRISGNNAKEIALKIFSPVGKRNIDNVSGFSAIYGRVNDSDGDIDDVVVTVYNSPKSYTGENVVEISCHGGLYLTKRILRACIDNGARLAQAGEFTKRAFLNKKLTLTQAEAVMDLISSTSYQANQSALSARDGSTFKRIQDIKSILIDLVAHLTAWVDYPEEGIEDFPMDEIDASLNSAKAKMENLLKTYDVGKIFRNGVDTVIVGRPNVGKSTLMNLLSGTNKSIVTHIAGTTRDIVEDVVQVGDIVLNIADTAGLRQTEDVVESVGVELAQKRLANSYLALAVFDGSKEFLQQDKELVDQIKDRPTVAIINKTDLDKNIDDTYIKQNIKNIVYISADKGNGLQDLSDKICEIIGLNNVDTSSGIVANERQRACLSDALNELNSAIEAFQIGMTLDAVNVCVDYSIQHLLTLTGENASEAVISKVFENFCVGK